MNESQATLYYKGFTEVIEVNKEKKFINCEIMQSENALPSRNIMLYSAVCL